MQTLKPPILARETEPQLYAVLMSMCNLHQNGLCNTGGFFKLVFKVLIKDFSQIFRHGMRDFSKMRSIYQLS